MKPRELAYCLGERVFPVLWQKVRRILMDLAPPDTRLRLLDVGGRKSYYTTHVNWDVDIIDLPRESEVQKALGLGLTEVIMANVRRRRSNIQSIRLEDMTKTTLPSDSYDGVVSVEVIEHVPDDVAFVRQIYRVLKPGGVFIVTTPNGEVVPNQNPDHVRHYRRTELETRLRESFPDVQVVYGVRSGYLHKTGVRGFVHKSLLANLKVPWFMFCAFLASLREGESWYRASGTTHLIGIARKPKREPSQP